MRKEKLFSLPRRKFGVLQCSKLTPNPTDNYVVLNLEHCGASLFIFSQQIFVLTDPSGT
ncbi:hypothetical protein MA16_Dca021743 [Dendrobium catenatum]|uniref:Uncharacterized protein n=1 Tax=Dendrobium catenatum TaxID=906689 RepID=A0A2I0W8C3_9ASPA|nr:hypothetical protein MA16_Dca021743 [Dendrobium catenatum]